MCIRDRLEGAVFGLYAKEDIVNKDGKVIVKADTQIERGVTGKDGKVTFTSDLPLGQYYVKEIEAPKGYVKSDKIFDVDASYQGDKVKVIEFKAAFENAPVSYTHLDVYKRQCSHWLEHSLRMVQQHLQPVRRQILRSGMHQSKIPEK